VSNATAVNAVKENAGMSIGLGILLVILGIMAMGSPLVTGVAVSMMAGAFLFVGGVFRCIYAFKARTWGKGVLAFVIGALTLIAGILMMARPLYAIGTLTLADGIFELAHGFQLRPLSGWGWTAFSGVISIVLGIMIWSQWPLSGGWAIGILVGIKLLFAGWSLIGIGMAAKSLAAEAE